MEGLQAYTTVIVTIGGRNTMFMSYFTSIIMQYYELMVRGLYEEQWQNTYGNYKSYK